MQQDEFKTRQRVNQYIDWAVKLLIVAMFGFVWKMYEQQQELITKQALTDAKIAQIADNTNIRITQLEKDIARLEGTMVTMDALKRAELLLELILQKTGSNRRVNLVPDKAKQ